MNNTKTKNTRNKQKKQLASNLLFKHEDLQHIFDEQESLCGLSYRERLFPPQVALQLFIEQALDTSRSCDGVVEIYANKIYLERGFLPSINSGGFCKARGKLPEQYVDAVFKETARHIEGRAGNADWEGLKLKLIDGTTLSMPDTVKNEAEYPQSKTQHEDTGFPILRMCALISVASGAVLDYRLSPYQGKGTGETSLFLQMTDGLQSSDLVLGDRLYGNYTVAEKLIKQEVKFLFRSHIKRKITFEHGIRLGKKDHKVIWDRPKCPKGKDNEFHDALPEKIEIREFEFDGVSYTTNLLDPRKYKKKSS